jgi:hypothetical protein
MLGTSSNPGVTPRLCQELLSKVNELLRYGAQVAAALEAKVADDESLASIPPDTMIVSEASLSASFYEIYNEKVYDLLSMNTDIACRVREHPNDGAYVENITLRRLNNYGDVTDILEEGHRKRTTAATLMNAASSRSHAIFTIHLEQQLIHVSELSSSPTSGDAISFFASPTTPSPVKRRNSVSSKTPNSSSKRHGGRNDNSAAVRRCSKINLVDLAGSERVSLTGVSGQQLVEANNINKSLSTLGDVIKALSESNQKTSKREAHVPYRNSILTWLLKESLSGNSKSTMLAAISPVESSYQETMSTLRYIERVKAIITHATRNEAMADSSLIASLNQQIKQLKRDLKSSRAAQSRLETENQDMTTQINYYRGLLESKSLVENGSSIGSQIDNDFSFIRQELRNDDNSNDSDDVSSLQDSVDMSGGIVLDNIEVSFACYDFSD